MARPDPPTPTVGQSPGSCSRGTAAIVTKRQRRRRWSVELRRVCFVKRDELLWLALALVFNLVWELAQLGFYDLSVMHASVAYAVVYCTLGDGMITAVSYLIVVVVTRSRTWPYTKPWKGMTVMLVLTITSTAWSEWRNVSLVHNWAYGALMPLIAGIGALPLLQWIVVPVAILITVRRFEA